MKHLRSAAVRAAFVTAVVNTLGISAEQAGASFQRASQQYRNLPLTPVAEPQPRKKAKRGSK